MLSTEGATIAGGKDAMQSQDIEALSVVESFSVALYDREWEKVAGFFGPDSVYWDVPVGPSFAAKGPDDIVVRLRLGVDALVSFATEHLRTAIVGNLVMSEHNELWVWPEGQTVTLPVVSVFEVSGSTITLWKDYWDYQTLTAAAPPSWVETLASSDLSWVYDASGRS
jgi:limonene-1,2-epoxide hydrolase